MKGQRAGFDVDISGSAPRDFATLSGDWNPLHTDPEYAAKTSYGRPVLHGAFAAGLVSRMAGMHLPGTECLLHNMRLKFVAPIVPPAALHVAGEVRHESGDGGSVAVIITDRASGRTVVEAAYDYGLHRSAATPVADLSAAATGPGSDAAVLVTGATGAMGGAVLAALGPRGIGASRAGGAGLLPMADPARLEAALGDRKLAAIVHCAWPAPDNTALTRLADVTGAVTHHVAEPLAQIVALAQLVKRRGIEGAALILVGSTAGEPGRHAYRKPLYSIAKAMIPTLARALAVELGASGQRCTALVFDALDGGMNGGLSAAARVAHADRSPFGLLPDMTHAARQVLWVLDNQSPLASGAVITVSGGALP